MNQTKQLNLADIKFYCIIYIYFSTFYVLKFYFNVFISMCYDLRDRSIPDTKYNLCERARSSGSADKNCVESGCCDPACSVSSESPLVVSATDDVWRGG